MFFKIDLDFVVEKLKEKGFKSSDMECLVFDQKLIQILMEDCQLSEALYEKMSEYEMENGNKTELDHLELVGKV